MDSFIHSEVGQTSLDSHGHFTLNTRQAIEKMVLFQLPDPNYWALKLVQAAVASGASQISFSPGVRTTRVAFVPSEAWPVEVMEADLFNPAPSPTAALFHFKQSIWSAAFSQNTDFELKLPGSPWVLFYENDQLRREKRSPAAELRLTLQQAPDEQLGNLLLERACSAPIKVLFDHDPIQNLISKEPPYYLEVLPSPEAPLAVSESTFQSYQSRRPAHRFKSSRDLRSGWPMLISENPHARSDRLHWVADGIILQSQAFPNRAGALRLDFYVSAAGLQLDAGGTRLVTDEPYRARLDIARQLLFERLERLEIKQVVLPLTNHNTTIALVGSLALCSYLLHPLLGVVATFAGAVAGLAAAGKGPSEFEVMQRLADFKASILPSGYRPPQHTPPA
jgi:hypothetical protein